MLAFQEIALVKPGARRRAWHALRGTDQRRHEHASGLYLAVLERHVPRAVVALETSGDRLAGRMLAGRTS